MDGIIFYIIKSGAVVQKRRFGSHCMIGRSGGYEKNQQVYFAIRHNAKPLNPLQ